MRFAAILGSVRREMPVAPSYQQQSEAESGKLATAAGTVSCHVTPKRHARAAVNDEPLVLTDVLNFTVPRRLQTMQLPSNTAPRQLNKTAATSVSLRQLLSISF